MYVEGPTSFQELLPDKTCMESHNVPSEGTSSVCHPKSHARKLSVSPRIVRYDTAHEVASMYGEFTP